MATIQTICDYLEQFAPVELAAEWDNVGLLVGDRDRSINKIMTCLTVTPASAREAIDEQADLIVAHHPLPFRSLRRLTTDTTPGRLLLDLIGARVAIYSPHTAFDSAAVGINQRLSEGLGLVEIQALVPAQSGAAGVGSGRCGRLSQPSKLADLAARTKKFLSLDRLHMVGEPGQMIEKVAVACGSAGQYIEQAAAFDCDLLLTGETNFHTCLEAEATGIALLLPGHYASERFAVEELAGILAKTFGDLTIWASRRESDPLHWI